ncbi:hypothetical protein [Stenotrophomonas sp. PD6]|uniref:hypothetical protein n=1 Tax=Stenotrophomonas sp. PD6 TaxID=3368612 RepID=UPI003BA3049B
MNPSYAYCALIDVLGYKQRLKEDQDRGEFTFKDDLEVALRCLDSVNSAVFNVQAISDTIVITCTSHGLLVEFLGVLKEVFLGFLQRGLYVRGGVAYSKHFHSNRLTYSHAIARAYELESGSAIYPRIVVDKNIVEMDAGPSSQQNLKGSGILSVQNGLYFVNVIDVGNFKEVYSSARDLYVRDANALVGKEAPFGKHVWFETYLREYYRSVGVEFEGYTDQIRAY